MKEEINKLLTGLILAVDCEFKWGNWSQCPVTCGGGTQSREKIIIRNATHGGSECKAPFNDTQECNQQKCPGMVHVVPPWYWVP